MEKSTDKGGGKNRQAGGKKVKINVNVNKNVDGLLLGFIVILLSIIVVVGSIGIAYFSPSFWGEFLDWLVKNTFGRLSSQWSRIEYKFSCDLKNKKYFEN